MRYQKRKKRSVSKIKEIGEHRKLGGAKNVFIQDLTSKFHKLNNVIQQVKYEKSEDCFRNKS